MLYVLYSSTKVVSSFIHHFYPRSRFKSFLSLCSTITFSCEVSSNQSWFIIVPTLFLMLCLYGSDHKSPIKSRLDKIWGLVKQSSSHSFTQSVSWVKCLLSKKAVWAEISWIWNFMQIHRYYSCRESRFPAYTMAS